MVTIVKRGTNASSFTLSDGRSVVLQPEPVLNAVSERDFAEIMSVYGDFIKPRILSDKNPSGCFVISEKSQKAADQSEEAGKLKDGSAPVSEEDLLTETEDEETIEVVGNDDEETDEKEEKQTAKRGRPKKNEAPKEEKEKEGE